MDENLGREIIRAAKKGDVATVRRLLARDESLVRARDRDGSTPLHCGTTPLHAAAHGDRKQVAALLIARGADLRAQNLNGRTPLGETGLHSARAVAKLLTEHGAKT